MRMTTSLDANLPNEALKAGMKRLSSSLVATLSGMRVTTGSDVNFSAQALTAVAKQRSVS